MFRGCCFAERERQPGGEYNPNRKNRTGSDASPARQIPLTQPCCPMSPQTTSPGSVDTNAGRGDVNRGLKSPFREHRVGLLQSILHVRPAAVPTSLREDLANFATAHSQIQSVSDVFPELPHVAPAH